MTDRKSRPARLTRRTLYMIGYVFVTMALAMVVGCLITIPPTDDNDIPRFGTAVNIEDLFYLTGEVAEQELPMAENEGRVLYYRLSSNLPTGLVFNPLTRIISGTPTRPTNGAIGLVYTVIDDDDNNDPSDSDSLSFTITIEDDRQPSFGTPVDIANLDLNYAYVQERTNVNQELAAAIEGSGNGTLIYSLAPIPDGLTFDPETRILRGTPTMATIETLVIDYTVRDSDSNDAIIGEDRDIAILTVMVTITPNSAPVFDGGVVIEDFYLVGDAVDPVPLPEATGGDGDRIYSLAPTDGGTLPGWLTFTDTTINRTLTIDTAVAGMAMLRYTVTDQDGAIDADTVEFAVDIQSDDNPMLGSNDSIEQRYTMGVEIASLSLPSATGGNGDHVYTLTPDVAAFGLAFNPETRILSGTPTMTTTNPVTFRYTVGDSDSNDAPGDTDTIDVVVTIAGNSMPSFSTTPVPDIVYVLGGLGTSARDLTATLPMASDGNQPLTYTLTQVGGAALPAGITFDDQLRQVTITEAPGAVEIAGDYPLIYTVADLDGDMVNVSVTVVIQDDVAPTFDSTAASLSYTETMAGPITVTLPAATGGNRLNASGLTYSLATVDGMEITNDNTGSFPWVSFDPATLELTVDRLQDRPSVALVYTVADHDLDEVAQPFSIVITDSNPTFATIDIDDQTYATGEAILPWALPTALSNHDEFMTGAITFGLGGLPAGLVFVNGRIEGTPAPSAINTMTPATYTVTDSDPTGTADSIVFTINIIDVPTNDGTVGNPYLVATPAELRSIATGFSSANPSNYVKQSGGWTVDGVRTFPITQDIAVLLAAHYQQSADITLCDNPNSGCTEFVPIGSATGPLTGPFTGVFDGNNHFISGLMIDGATAGSWGLFAVLRGSDAQIRDVTLINVAVTGIGDVGALVGTVTERATVTESGVDSGTVNKARGGAESNIGGLVGFVNGSGGSLADGRPTIQGSYAKVAVSDDDTSTTADNLGGLIGHTANLITIIQNNYATGDVTGTGGNDSVGGLLGHGGIPSAAQIENGYARGTVRGGDGDDNVGGLAGVQIGIIRYTYAIGTVMGDAGNDMAGGLLGSGTPIDDVEKSHYDNTNTIDGENKNAWGALRTNAQLTCPTNAGFPASVDITHGGVMCEGATSYVGGWALDNWNFDNGLPQIRFSGIEVRDQ